MIIFRRNKHFKYYISTLIFSFNEQCNIRINVEISWLTLYNKLKKTVMKIWRNCKNNAKCQMYNLKNENTNIKKSKSTSKNKIRFSFDANYCRYWSILQSFFRKTLYVIFNIWYTLFIDNFDVFNNTILLKKNVYCNCEWINCWLFKKMYAKKYSYVDDNRFDCVNFMKIITWYFRRQFLTKISILSMTKSNVFSIIFHIFVDFRRFDHDLTHIVTRRFRFCYSKLPVDTFARWLSSYPAFLVGGQLATRQTLSCGFWCYPAFLIGEFDATRQVVPGDLAAFRRLSFWACRYSACLMSEYCSKQKTKRIVLLKMLNTWIRYIHVDCQNRSNFEIWILPSFNLEFWRSPAWFAGDLSATRRP